jgi:hypothetical protein
LIGGCFGTRVKPVDPLASAGLGRRMPDLTSVSNNAIQRLPSLQQISCLN